MFDMLVFWKDLYRHPESNQHIRFCKRDIQRNITFLELEQNSQISSSHLSFHRLTEVMARGHTAKEGELNSRTPATLPHQQCGTLFILQFHGLDSHRLAQIHYVRAQALFFFPVYFFWKEFMDCFLRYQQSNWTE